MLGFWGKGELSEASSALGRMGVRYDSIMSPDGDRAVLTIKVCGFRDENDIAELWLSLEGGC